MKRVCFLLFLLGACAKDPAPPPASPDAAPDVVRNIVVTSPASNARVAMPLVIEGEARTFESSFAWRIKDAAGAMLTEGYGTAAAPDVGTFGPFREEVIYTAPSTKNGSLEVFEYSAQDGSEINKVVVPILFPENQITIELFYPNEKLNPNAMPCGKVFPVKRRIPHTKSVAKAAIVLLARGLTPEEKESGYSSVLPDRLELKSIKVVDGVAVLDFNEELRSVSGACSVEAARAQLRTTLLQFPGIRDIALSVNGDSRDVLEP